MPLAKFLAWLLSSHKRRFPLKVVIGGLVLQFTLALLVLKTFFKTDYRGLIQMLRDFRELREDLGLDKVPHYSTLCKAVLRLLKKGSPFFSPSRPPCALRPAA